MNILTENVEKYLSSINIVDDPVLNEMYEFGKSKNFPLVGPEVGKLLYLLSELTKPKIVFELGSGFGYSAAWFSKGMNHGSKIYCTDGSEDNVRLAKDYFKRINPVPEIDFICGDALEVFDNTAGEFDIIFCDIDKWQYPEALQKAFPRLKNRGLFITDNTLWEGKVADDNNYEKNTLAIRDFNSFVSSMKNTISTLIPIRDGVTVCMKL